ncbi:hypothetical protein ADIMK_0404 [Marinobacterium lacunae]|uniref:Uncharacterized protein n=1 Tax=Marinobacterium lacunae TaxID=1232683 RepID=A0A081G3U2_9GAMM|nr:hypothetical protein ADIMK_0404 [Marinobacterium lacunae]
MDFGGVQTSLCFSGSHLSDQVKSGPDFSRCQRLTAQVYQEARN